MPSVETPSDTNACSDCAGADRDDLWIKAVDEPDDERCMPQEFHAFGQVWLVEEALRRVVDSESRMLLIDDRLRDDARFLTSGELTSGANVAEPILVIPLPPAVFGPNPGHQVMDGWHRIAKALDEGLEEVPAHFLTPADERSCRVADEWDEELLNGLREAHDAWHPTLSSGERPCGGFPE
jgi:hypothetical protein